MRIPDRTLFAWIIYKIRLFRQSINDNSIYYVVIGFVILSSVSIYFLRSFFTQKQEFSDFFLNASTGIAVLILAGVALLDDDIIPLNKIIRFFLKAYIILITCTLTYYSTFKKQIQDALSNTKLQLKNERLEKERTDTLKKAIKAASDSITHNYTSALLNFNKRWDVVNNEIKSIPHDTVKHFITTISEKPDIGLSKIKGARNKDSLNITIEMRNVGSKAHSFKIDLMIIPKSNNEFFLLDKKFLPLYAKVDFPKDTFKETFVSFLKGYYQYYYFVFKGSYLDNYNGLSNISWVYYYKTTDKSWGDLRPDEIDQLNVFLKSNPKTFHGFEIH